MIQCPLCKKPVPKLKSNSHIIPAWMLREIKQNGKMVKIGPHELHEKYQADPKADIVCADCEDRFTEVDTFSALFFRDKKFLREIRTLSENNKSIQVEIHDPAIKVVFSGFIMSLALRMHLFNKFKKLDPILGPYFDDMGAQFLERKLDQVRFPLISAKFENLSGAHFLPYKTKIDGRICIEVMLFGYRVWIFTDGLPPDAETIISATFTEFVVPIANEKEVRILTDLRSLISRLKR